MREDIDKLSHKDKVRFALFCAKQVIHLTKAKEVHLCIEVVESWLVGKATKKECRDAAYAADAAYCAIRASSDKEKIRQEQRNYLNDLLYLDEIFEKEVLM